MFENLLWKYFQPVATKRSIDDIFIDRINSKRRSFVFATRLFPRIPVDFTTKVAIGWNIYATTYDETLHAFVDRSVSNNFEIKNDRSTCITSLKRRLVSSMGKKSDNIPATGTC